MFGKGTKKIDGWKEEEREREKGRVREGGKRGRTWKELKLKNAKKANLKIRQIYSFFLPLSLSFSLSLSLSVFTNSNSLSKQKNFGPLSSVQLISHKLKSENEREKESLD